MIDQMVGGRKILAGLVILAVGLAVVMAKGDIPPNLLSLLQVVFGAFVLGNGIEHITDVAQAHVESKAAASAEPATNEPSALPQAPTPETPQVAPDTRLDEILANTRDIREAAATTQQGLSLILQLAGGARRPPQATPST